MLHGNAKHAMTLLTIACLLSLKMSRIELQHLITTDLNEVHADSGFSNWRKCEVQVLQTSKQTKLGFTKPELGVQVDLHISIH